MSSPSALALAAGTYTYIAVYSIGFIGHTFSLITYSSKTLRQTSTGLLFIFLTLSDFMYQLMTIRDFIVLYLSIPTVQHEAFCRFRQFIINFASFTSAWLLVLIAIDRFIRVRFPHQQGRLCTCKMAFYSCAVVCVCSILLTCHVLQSEFGYTDLKSNTCGPSRSPITVYNMFYFNIWSILQLLITYFIPSCLMILTTIGIYSKVRSQRTLVVATARREKIQQQMLLMMVSSVICFAVCTLSYSIHRSIYLRTGVTASTVNQIIIITAVFNLNYCLNFYVHCLASKLFRQTFIEQLRRFWMYMRNQGRRINNNNNTVIPLMTVSR